jgi:hypothetical protein
VGLLLGALLARAAAPPGLRPHVVAAVGLGNVGNLPLVLVAALVREAGLALGAVSACRLMSVGADLGGRFGSVCFWGGPQQPESQPFHSCPPPLLYFFTKQDATVERGVAYVALGIVVANMSHL